MQENIQKQSLDTGLGAVKFASKKVLHKAGQFLGNKIADAVTKSNNDKIVKPGKNPRNVKEINISLEKRDEILKNLRKGLTETAKHEMKKARRQNFSSFVSTLAGSLVQPVIKITNCANYKSRFNGVFWRGNLLRICNKSG